MDSSSTAAAQWHKSQSQLLRSTTLKKCNIIASAPFWWGLVHQWSDTAVNSVCTLRSYRWSFSCFQPWKEAGRQTREDFGQSLEKKRPNKRQPASNADLLTVQIAASTYWSRHHVVHEGPQTPPVHCSVVAQPGQDLWGPAHVEQAAWRWRKVENIK